MKVLILGSKGNLGVQLKKVLKNSYKVIGWDREELDITNEIQAKNKISDLNPDIIINAVAYNAVDKCEADEKWFDLAKKINGEAVGFLADISLKLGSLLVHYSTDYVFDGKKEEGYLESDKPSPINKYGDTKLIGENKILKRAEQGLKFYIIRTSKLFGPKGDSELSKPSFFDTMLELNNQKNEISVVDDEKSCFTYTPDLAKATDDLIKENKDYGIYHVTNQGPCTWYEAIAEFFEIINKNANLKPVLSEELKRPARRPKNSVLLNTKLQPLRDYREALKEVFSK